MYGTAKRFNLDPDKPSQLSFFLRLTRSLAFSMRQPFQWVLKIEPEVTTGSFCGSKISQESLTKGKLEDL